MSITLVKAIDVPCEPCDGAAAGASAGLRCCKVAKPDLVAQIEKAIEKDRIEKLYPTKDDAARAQLIQSCRTIRAAQGKPGAASFNITNMQGLDVDTCTPYGPVCNPLDGEMTTSKQGDSCGSTVAITPNGGVAELYQGVDHGTLENADRGGAWIQALRCYKTQVLVELQAGTINVSKACQTMASDIADLYHSAQDVSRQQPRLATTEGLGRKDAEAIANGEDHCVDEVAAYRTIGSAAVYDPTAVKNRHASCLPVLSIIL